MFNNEIALVNKWFIRLDKWETPFLAILLILKRRVVYFSVLSIFRGKVEEKQLISPSPEQP